MTFEEFNQLQERAFDRIRELRETKGREYAPGEGDTLADFKEIAAEMSVNPLVIWAAYVKKHERAIDTFIREGHVKSEAIEDRVMDVVTYHLLFLGLLQDRRSEQEARQREMELARRAQDDEHDLGLDRLTVEPTK